MLMMRSSLLRCTARLATAPTKSSALPLRPSCFSTLVLRDSYDYVTVEKRGDQNSVGLITLNRPKALNALCDDLFTDLIHASTALDQDDEIGCLVLTGSTKAFAAGADISEMKDRTFDYAYKKVGFVRYMRALHGEYCPGNGIRVFLTMQ